MLGVPYRRLGMVEVGDQCGVVRWSLLAAADVVDPGGVQPGGECVVAGDQVDPHSEIAGVADSVVPPREPASARSPSGHVDIDEAGGEQASEGFALWRGDMGGVDERVGVEDVTVGSGDVDVTGHHDVSVEGEPLADAFGERVEECQLVLIVPVVDGAAVWDVNRNDAQRLMSGDLAADETCSRSSASPPKSPEDTTSRWETVMAIATPLYGPDPTCVTW